TPRKARWRESWTAEGRRPAPAPGRRLRPPATSPARRRAGAAGDPSAMSPADSAGDAGQRIDLREVDGIKEEGEGCGELDQPRGSEASSLGGRGRELGAGSGLPRRGRQRRAARRGRGGDLGGGRRGGTR